MSIGADAFYCCFISSVSIGKSVSEIGSGAFYYCNRLTKAEFGSIESLCNIKFDNYTSNPLYYAHHLYVDGAEVNEIVVPSSVTGLLPNVFYGGSALTKIELGNSITSIGAEAFRDCSGLKNMEIPNSVMTIGENAFSSCKNLASLKLPDGLTSISAELCSNCTNLTDVNIPVQVKTIGKKAFYGCSITTVHIPDNVTTIGADAFCNCAKLEEVTFGRDLKEIGDYAFSGCYKLTRADMLPGLTKIGERVFMSCVNLSSITIPYSVTTIGQNAFESCLGLREIYCNIEKPFDFTSGIDSYLYDVTVLYIPKGTLDAYRQINAWKNFKNIKDTLADVEDALINESDASVEVYNLNGVRVADSTAGLAKGVYIVRRGSIITKIAVK